MIQSPKQPFLLNESERYAFTSVIKEVNNVSASAHPQPNCTNYQLVRNSSKYAVCATLYQIVEGNPISVGFFSKSYLEHKLGIQPLTENF